MAAQNLLSADLRGVDSHGVARLSGYYRLYEAKRLNPKANYQLIHETPSTGTLDADAGLGLVAAELAMGLAIEKAKQVGSGWVAVQNSNHFGIAGRYALMAAEQGMIGFAFTNASPLVAPTHGLDRLLGTNPIAVAVPAGKERPFVADLATTTAANGKLEVLQRKDQTVPAGWVQTQEGEPSNDPTELTRGGTMLPLGGTPEGASYKGYALGSVVDILSGVLPGASFGPWVPPFVAFLQPREDQPGRGLGHLLGALRVDAFRPIEDFRRDMDLWITTFRNSQPKLGEQVQVPGDPEWRCQDERLQNGIPLLPAVIEDLNRLAETCKVKGL